MPRKPFRQAGAAQAAAGEQQAGGKRRQRVAVLDSEKIAQPEKKRKEVHKPQVKGVAGKVDVRALRIREMPGIRQVRARGHALLRVGDGDVPKGKRQGELRGKKGGGKDQKNGFLPPRKRPLQRRGQPGKPQKKRKANGSKNAKHQPVSGVQRPGREEHIARGKPIRRQKQGHAEKQKGFGKRGDVFHGFPRKSKQKSCQAIIPETRGGCNEKNEPSAQNQRLAVTYCNKT